MATATSLTAVDLAVSAVESQRRLLADARRLATATAEARIEREAAVAKLLRRETGAVQASAADRANLELAGELTLARTQLEHARSDLSQAVQDDEAASTRVKETEGRLLDAEGALEASQIEEQLADGSFETEAKAIADSIVSSIVVASAAVARHRDLLDRDGALVRRLHELGAGADVAERDGSCLAGFLGAAIIEAGGHAAHPVDRNAYELRYPLDRPAATSTGPAQSVTRLVEIVLASLAQGERDRAAGFPDRGIAPLQDITAWTGCRSSLAVRALTEGRSGARAHAKAENDRAAHEQRLASSKARADAQRGRAVLSIAVRDTVIGPPVVAPLPPELGLEVEVSAPPAPPTAAASRAGSAPAPAPRSTGNAPDSLGPGDYVLPGSADAPGGNPFPTSLPPGTPAGETNVTYNPSRRR
jgi:hypothetical protein